MKLIVIFALILTIAGCNKSEEGPNANTVPSPKLAQCAKDTDCKGDRICEKGACTNPQTVNNGTSANQTALAQQSSTKLSRIFSPKMLSANIEYLEQITGPARQTIMNSKTYDVDGCDVTAVVANGTIGSLRLDLNQKCTFDLNAFVNVTPGRFPSANVMTIGEFDSLTNNQGQLRSDCIYMCGNAVEPTVSDFWEGPHADQFIEVRAEVTLVDDAAINASIAWKNIMEKGEGEDWVINTKFNCQKTKYDDSGHKLFKDVKLSAITIGYGLEVPHC